jgi:hypothetical protein
VEVPRETTASLIAVAVVLALTAVIVFMGAVEADLVSRFTLFIVLLLALIALLIASVYPKRSPYFSDQSVDQLWDYPGGVSGKNDARYRQLGLYARLGGLMSRRVQARRGISGEEWTHIRSDGGMLMAFLKDEDLYKLIILSSEPPGSLINPEGLGFILGEGFEERFDYLMRKVEAWQ